MALGVVYIRTVKAQYQSGFTINADGSISLSTAPLQEVGDSYILTSNVVGTITDQRSNVVLNGNGYTITGGGAWATIAAYAVVYGVQLDSVGNVTIENFVITECPTAIELNGDSNVTVRNNTITDSASEPVGLEPTEGVDIGGSSNIIAGNNFLNDSVAISLTSWSPGQCTQNLIVGNNFTDCSTAFLLYESSNNTIYHNNFNDNVNTVQDTGYLGYGVASVNFWDDGYPSGGNYWSNYLTTYPNASMIDDSGIGNTPYPVITSGFVNPNPSGLSSSATNFWNQLNSAELKNIDRYPLMEPFGDAYLLNYRQEITPSKVSVLSPLNQTYSKSTVSLDFSINKPVNWIGYSLDGQQNVTITGNSTITNIAYGLHNITVYVNDTFGILSRSQTINFTVAKPEPFPTATVAAASGALTVVVVVAGLLVYFKKRKPKTHRVIEGELA